MKSALVQTTRRTAWLLIFTLFTTGYAWGEEREPGGMKRIEGSILYRERMMLPPNAEITVTLEDVSKMDVAADIIATTTFPAVGGPPWDFAMDYDPARIDSRHRYAVRARIEVNGQLMFTNME